MLPADVRARLHAMLAEADPTLRLCDEADGRAGGDEQRARYDDDTWEMGTLWSSQLWSACREIVASLERIAETPPRNIGDITGVETESALFVDVNRPDTLLYAPNPAMPAALFVAIPADVAGVRAVLAEYAGDRERTVELRAWMGFGSSLRIPNVYSGELAPVDDHELERFFVFSPVAGTLSRRTFFSGSYFSYEIHGEDLYIWDLAYPPCTTSAAVLARFRDITGYAFPPDMPVDLASAIHGFEFSTAAELEQRLLREPPPTVAAILTVLAAIDHTAMATPLRLRRYASDSVEIQRALCSVAFSYGWERLAWDMLRAITDATLQGHLADALAGLEFDAPVDVTGVRRVLPPGAAPASLHALAAARGWTARAIADDDTTTRADYDLPGSTAAAPRRIVWRDVPALELSTLALHDAADQGPAIDAAFPDAAPPEDRWRTAAALAWLGAEAPLLEHLRTALAAADWTERLIAARLIGQARVRAALGLVRAAREREAHTAVRKALDAVLALFEPAAAAPPRRRKSSQ